MTYHVSPITLLIYIHVFFCQVMHGGLFSDDNVTLDDIRAVDRFRQPPDSGQIAIIFWAII